MSQKLTTIFENIDVLVGKNNFMVLPNETFQFSKALSDAKIISLDRLMVAWDILTYKHDEKNPFPSHETLAEKFKIGVRAMTGAVSEIVKVGLFINEKGKYGTDKRKNTYNVSPLLNLLGCFVERVREGIDVDIKELFNEVIHGTTKARKVSTKVEEPKKEEPKKEEPKKEVGLSEAINNALATISESRRQALTNIIPKHVDRLDDETIIYYINRVDEKCTDESKFYSFASTCFKNASNGDKKKEEQTPASNGGTSYKGSYGAKKVDMQPDWFDGSQEANRQRAKKHKELEEAYGDVISLFEHEKGIKVSTESEYIRNEEALVNWYNERIKDFATREDMAYRSMQVYEDSLEVLFAEIGREYTRKTARLN